MFKFDSRTDPDLRFLCQLPGASLNELAVLFDHDHSASGGSWFELLYPHCPPEQRGPVLGAAIGRLAAPLEGSPANYRALLDRLGDYFRLALPPALAEGLPESPLLAALLRRILAELPPGALLELGRQLNRLPTAMPLLLRHGREPLTGPLLAVLAHWLGLEICGVGLGEIPANQAALEAEPALHLLGPPLWRFLRRTGPGFIGAEDLHSPRLHSPRAGAHRWQLLRDLEPPAPLTRPRLLLALCARIAHLRLLSPSPSP